MLARALGGLSIKGRALRYLAQREYSRAELERKLMWALQRSLTRHAELEPVNPTKLRQDVHAMLDELTDKGFLSDTRTAAQVLASKGTRFGVNRLRQELQAKGLDATLVASTLAQARLGEYEQAAQVWRRKFGTIALDTKGRAQQMRFLAGRGFSSDVIGRVLRRVGDEVHEADEASEADAEG